MIAARPAIRGLFLALIAIAIWLCGSMSAAQAANGTIPVYVNNDRLQFSTDPVLEEGTALVEFRPIFEKLGLQVGWNSQTKTVTGFKAGTLLELKIGSKFALLNSERIELAAAPKVINGHTLIPLRFVGEATGSFVEWEPGKRTIRITRPEPVIVKPANDVQFDGLSTSNSMLRLSGELEKSVKTIIVGVFLQNTSMRKWAYLEPGNGKLDGKVYLNLGQGTYDVHVYSTDEPKESSAFERAVWLRSAVIENSDPRDPDLAPSELIESEAPEIVALAGEITAGLTSEREKSRAIHDWVASHIDYDAKTFMEGGDRVDSALQTLRGKLTDCDGYARLNAALHRAAGIKARLVIGTVIVPDEGESWDRIDSADLNHAWNEVYIDGRWVVQDPTWNAGYVDSATGLFVRDVTHKYYDPDPYQFALDHRKANVEYKYE